MRPSIANSVAGGLIGSAVVMGVDAIDGDAEAASVTYLANALNASSQIVDFDSGAMTCCPGEFEFEQFDRSLGDLTEATVGLTVAALGVSDAFGAGMTCCPGFEDLVGIETLELSVNGNTVDFTTDFVEDLLDGDFEAVMPLSELIDLNRMQTASLNRLSINLDIQFTDDVGLIEPGTAPVLTTTLSYSYTPATIPLPGAAILGFTGMLGLGAVRLLGRRRED